MNKNKGFIGIGLIIAIILGIAVVGGGAYYLGKSGSQQEVKVVENQILKENQNQSDSIPSIAVLSPNGGESYKVGDTMNIKWTGCNSDQNMSIYLTSPELKSPVTELSIVRNIKCSNNSYGYKIPSSVYGYGISTTLNGNKYKVVVSNGMNGGYGGIDSSDNYFTINSTKTVSTASCTSDKGNSMTFQKALEIAKKSSCNNVGKFIGEYDCNKNNGGLVDVYMEPTNKPGCAFACRVSIDTGKTEEGWMCTGAL